MENKNYKVIINHEELERFIDWLPELHKKETFYVCLFARGKYSDGTNSLGGGQLQLRRFISNKKFLFNKILQLECPIGSFTDSVGKPITQESLALYINPNPRNIEKATRMAIKVLTQKLLEPYNGYNPYSEVLSELQTATGRKVHMNFDYDGVELDEVLQEIKDKNILNLNALSVLKTRGGFHLLIKSDLVNEEYRKSWYLAMSKIKGHDKKSGSTDGLMPTPGCTQGGFSPYLITEIL